MIKPILTEKSLRLAKDGKYSFLIGRSDTKLSIKSEIASLFGVHVKNIKIVVGHDEKKRNTRGYKILGKGGKKAIVALKAGEKIDIFEEGKK